MTKQLKRIKVKTSRALAMLAAAKAILDRIEKKAPPTTPSDHLIIREVMGNSVGQA